jgi:hypothetical protein
LVKVMSHNTTFQEKCIIDLNRMITNPIERSEKHNRTTASSEPFLLCRMIEYGWTAKENWSPWFGTKLMEGYGTNGGHGMKDLETEGIIPEVKRNCIQYLNEKSTYSDADKKYLVNIINKGGIDYHTKQDEIPWDGSYGTKICQIFLMLVIRGIMS